MGKNKKQIGYDVDSDHSLEKTKNIKERKSLKRCGICNTKGHNSHTCPNLAESGNSEDNSENNSEDNSENNSENDSEETSIK
ncbi:hypothetical protein F8M41_016161 [Gigaspora margarita]|uniref:CCHC-type domain-containing protein n=1 Tax=Gigaspora margarita TaxID=4874 RepID=A0A8H3WT28_GIGMA|nr:hypothetical protein F8M41_016161 [Gigaspora margarita]